MREVSKAMLASGLVSEEEAHLLERWGLVGAASVAQRKDLLGALVEIERLVGKERGAYRVTELDVDLGKYDPGVFLASVGGSHYARFRCRWGSHGQLYVGRRESPPHLPSPGETLTVEGGARYRLKGGQMLYQDEGPAAMVFEVEDVDA